MDLNELWGQGGLVVAVPLIIALVALVKSAWEDVPKNYLPVVDVVLGVGFYIALAVKLQQDSFEGVVLGLIAGLTAAGLYSSGKAVTGN